MADKQTLMNKTSLWNGILNVNKKAGFTSSDVVTVLRGILHQKKIGHTGTLDPDAEGVLPVCLGNATRACAFLTDQDKEYRVVMLLGRTTDTEDISGRVIEERPVCCSEEQVREAVTSFLGEYDQIPPMFSAKKVGGRKLYELAREGRQIERKPNRVHIYGIRIEETALPEVAMTVRCSKGTYVRSLCRDIGENLGCGGCMKELLRTRVGVFLLENSLTLEDIRRLTDEEGLSRVIEPTEHIFSGLPVRMVGKEAERFLKNGNELLRHNLSETDEISPGQLYRIYFSDGKFAALYRGTDSFTLKPERMFLS